MFNVLKLKKYALHVQYLRISAISFTKRPNYYVNYFRRASDFSKMSKSSLLWKEASSAILMRKACGHLSSQQPGHVKLLILKRSDSSRFMPGLRVFPGGVVSKTDFSNEWTDMLQCFTSINTVGINATFQEFGMHTVERHSVENRPEMITAPRHINNATSADIGFRICAIRETFEESGVLLYKQSAEDATPITASSLKEWRDKVHCDSNEFLNMCKKFSITPDVWSLYEWTNWLTPTHMASKRRFDTMFYMAFVDNAIEAEHDDKEIVCLEVYL